MLSTLTKTARWSDLKELASGRLLRVFPPRSIASMAKLLLKAQSDDALREAALRTARDTIATTGLDIVVARPPDRGRIDGDELLRLYFAQMFSSSTALLDLRSTAFDGNAWQPARFVVDWDRAFLDAVRAMYSSFYDDKPDEFEQAVADLGLPGTADLFRQHFGDDPSCVRFELDEFRGTFEQILVESDRRGHVLSPWVGMLGLHLICLYEHLEQLGGGPYDVRAAFHDASVTPQQKSGDASGEASSAK